MSIQNPTNLDLAVAAAVGAAGGAVIQGAAVAPILNQSATLTAGEAGIGVAALALLFKAKQANMAKLAGAAGLGALLAYWQNWSVQVPGLSAAAAPAGTLPPVAAGTPTPTPANASGG